MSVFAGGYRTVHDGVAAWENPSDEQIWTVCISEIVLKTTRRAEIYSSSENGDYPTLKISFQLRY